MPLEAKRIDLVHAGLPGALVYGLRPSSRDLFPGQPLVAAVVGLVVAAAGIMIQYVSGVDFPTIPPGPIILLAGAAVVAFGPWRWSPVVGLVAALFLSIGGAIATIAGSGFSETLGDPGEVGAFAGAVVQLVGLAIALPAGIVAAKCSFRPGGVADRPRETH